jgi:hypothetical protein
MSGESITANTIPTSAIVGGGGVVLPTTTMTARTETQIGYQKSTTKATGTITSNSDTQFGTITLSPIGSVWILQAGINLGGGGNASRLQTPILIDVDQALDVCVHHTQILMKILTLRRFDDLGAKLRLIGPQNVPRVDGEAL